MGFRNPPTSATAVQTAQAGQRAFLHETTKTVGGVTTTVAALDFVNGDGSSGGSVYSSARTSTGGAALGGSEVMGGGTWLGVTAPTFESNVEEAPAGGYQPQARVKGAGLITDGPIIGAAPTDTAQLTLNTGSFVDYSGRSGGCYIDATGDVQFDGLLNNVGSIASGAPGVILGNVPSGYAPAVNRWFIVPVYPLSVVALVGVRASGSIILDSLSGPVSAGQGAWDISVISYNPTSTS